MAAPPDKQELNTLCKKCLRPCKQPSNCLLISCPRYQPPPFKIETPKFSQLDLFATPKKRR